MFREILAFAIVIMGSSDFSASNNKVVFNEADSLYEPNSSVELDSSLELDALLGPDPTGHPPVSILAINFIGSKLIKNENQYC